MSEPTNDLRAMPTVDLLGLVREGRREAANALWARYAPRVTDIVRMRLGGKLRGLMESGDILQEVLFDAFRGLEGFEMRDDSSLIRWLARHVENAIRSEAKHWTAQKRDADRAAPIPTVSEDDDEESAVELSGRLPTPSVEIGRAERAELVRAAIADLPERYREVILLRDYAGAAWEEVGEELEGLSANAASVLHSRAIAKLGKLLRERGID